MFADGGARLKTAPWWCAGLHSVAAIATLFLLRGGSEAGGGTEQRAAWVAAHSAQWRAGWLIWMVAAVSLLVFYAWWGQRVKTRAAKLALVIAAAGLACDLAGESMFIGWLPTPDSPLYRTAALLTGGAGNGLYTLAGIVLTRVTPQLGFLLRGWAWLVWTSGMALSIATLANVPEGVIAASAALMALFIPWVVMMGMRLR